MRRSLKIVLVLIIVAACDSQRAPVVVHDTVWLHDTVAVEAQAAPSTGTAARPESSLMERCVRAAHVQTAASDEITGAPSAVQDEAREANIRTICKLTPETFLPDLE